MALIQPKRNHQYNVRRDTALLHVSPQSVWDAPRSYLPVLMASKFLIPRAKTFTPQSRLDSTRFICIDPLLRVIIKTIGEDALLAGDGDGVLVLADARRFRVASVVPKELETWLRRCPGIGPISSGDALDGVEEYPTLGVDRALAVRGAARLR